MKSKGVNSIYILNDKEAYGLGVAKNVQGAAREARHQGPRLRRLRPEAAELPGHVHEDQGDEPGRDLHRRADRREQRPADQRQGRDPGPNVATPSEGVMLFLPDGFTTDAIFQRNEGGTPFAKGAFFSVADVGIDKYTGAALDFINGFKKTLGSKAVDPYSILGAQAAQVMLDAIAKSDGSRRASSTRSSRPSHERPDRELRVQRERRHHRREGCRPALHDLQGHEQARDPQDGRARGDLVEAAAQAAAG